MAHRVKIAPGINGITLPDGQQYDEDDEVVLTDAQFARIASTALGDEVLDLGEVDEPGAGGAGLPDTDEVPAGKVLGIAAIPAVYAEWNIGTTTEPVPDGGDFGVGISYGEVEAWTDNIPVGANWSEVSDAVVAALAGNGLPAGLVTVVDTDSSAIYNHFGLHADPAVTILADGSGLTGAAEPYEVVVVQETEGTPGSTEVGWVSPFPSPPENQQGIFVGASVGGSALTVWYPASKGDMWVGHESAGWVPLDAGDPGTVLQMNEDGSPEWVPFSGGAMPADNRQYYYVDPVGHTAINSGDVMPQDWTYYGDISTPSEDPNTITETGIQVGLAGWYAIHAAFTTVFDGAGRMEAALRVGGMMFGRQKNYKPAGQDDLDTEISASVFAVVYVDAGVAVLADANVTLPGGAGTWGVSDARLILHKLS